MYKMIIQEAINNKDLVSFRRKNEDGLELWYSGYVSNFTDPLVKIDTIYGNHYTFNLNELIDLKGPKVHNYMQNAFGEFQREPRYYVTFDTETTGLPQDFNAPVSAVDNWPRVIQLAWSIHDENGQEISHKNLIIKPDGFTIPEDTIKVHGITNEKALAEGIPLREALEIFNKDLGRSQVLVAHNISFDEKVVGCELYRMKMKDLIPDKEKVCTMESSVEFCKLPGRRGGYRRAKLVDLYAILFNEEFDNQHNASYDVRACAACFFELRKLGVIHA